jgi:integrase
MRDARHLVFSGIRLGELLALRWRDVDLADGWLHVGRSRADAGDAAHPHSPGPA